MKIKIGLTLIIAVLIRHIMKQQELIKASQKIEETHLKTIGILNSAIDTHIGTIEILRSRHDQN